MGKPRVLGQAGVSRSLPPGMPGAGTRQTCAGRPQVRASCYKLTLQGLTGTSAGTLRRGACGTSHPPSTAKVVSPCPVPSKNSTPNADRSALGPVRHWCEGGWPSYPSWCCGGWPVRPPISRTPGTEQAHLQGLPLGDLVCLENSPQPLQADSEKPFEMRAKTPLGTLLLVGTVCVLVCYWSRSLPQPPAGIPSSCRAPFGDSPVPGLAPRAPWWPLGAAEASGSWRGCSREGQSLETVTPKTHNPAGEHGARSRAAALTAQASVSWFREGKLINFACLCFAVAQKTLPEMC